MLDYKTCKLLEHVGFPQDHFDYGDKLFSYAYCAKENCCGNELHLIHKDNDEGGDVGNDYSHGSYSSWKDDPNYWKDIRDSYVKCPTLQELIDACIQTGKIERMTIEWEHAEWNAWGDGYYQHDAGDTPEEAVAMLYLELKSQKV